MNGTEVRASPKLAAAFRGLSSVGLRSLAGRASRREVGRGGFLFRTGDRSTHIFVIESGSLKICSSSPDGSESIIAILGPAEMVGELHSSVQSGDARALERSAALSIPTSHLRECLEAEGAAHLIADLLSERLRRTTATLHGVIGGDSRQRIAVRLCDLADYQGRRTSTGTTRLCIRLTQEDLGRMAGSSRETTNKVLAMFTRKGWIETQNGRYSITNERALREFAGL